MARLTKLEQARGAAQPLIFVLGDGLPDDALTAFKTGGRTIDRQPQEPLEAFTARVRGMLLASGLVLALASYEG